MHMKARRRNYKPAPEPQATPSQRADKWLWCVRIAKTRAMAAKMISAGHVRINRRKIARACAPVRPGDVLTIAHKGFCAVFEVTGLAEKRVGAKQAALLKKRLDAPESGRDAPHEGRMRQ